MTHLCDECGKEMVLVSKPDSLPVVLRCPKCGWEKRSVCTTPTKSRDPASSTVPEACDSNNLVIYPMPSLVSTLLNREQAKGSPLTEVEVIQIRDSCPSVAVPMNVAEQIDAQRGYKDIDPERCWEQWQEERKRLA